MKMRILLIFVFPFIITSAWDSSWGKYGEGKLVFRPLMHQPRIYSGAPAGVHVTTVHAYDPEKPRKKVEYNLPNVLDYKNFMLDKTSGNISTALQINKTVGETYQVMVTAVSYGSSELEHLQIAVTEFNQFSPRFEKEDYTIEFHPKTEVGTVVLKVKATDPDPVPINAEIYYILDQNTTSQYFDLDPLTGELSLNQPINDTSVLRLFGIYAEDGGSPKRWDYVSIYIIIKELSAPQNVSITDVTYNSAIVCWNAPKYGDVLGYVLKYYAFGSEAHFVLNMTAYDSNGDCRTLHNLVDDIYYEVQIYGWNQHEKGQNTDIFEFHTVENWCKKITCGAGTCIPLSSEPWYECECQNGYYGSSCEYFDPCSDNPCENNGKCLNTTNNEYVCICAEDYEGPNCKSYNPCLRRQNPCENGGTCEMTTTRNTYVCICAEGFYGRKCKFRDLCASNPCMNGATCNVTSETEFTCMCPPGFSGDLCEIDIDECASNPCLNGATCINSIGNFTCICPMGFTDQRCETSVQCPAGRTDTETGVYYWNSTNHTTVSIVKCPFGPLDTAPDAFASRACILENNIAFWGPVNASLCKGKGFVVADELAEELHSITKDPLTLNIESLEAAAQGIETISKYATQDKKLAEGLLKVISNVMDANDSVIRRDENNTFTTFSKCALQMVDDFVTNVEIKVGESINVTAPNIRIQSIEWSPETENRTDDDLLDHLELVAPTSNEIFQEEEKIITANPSIQDPPASFNKSKTTPTIQPPSEKPKVPIVQVFVPKEALEEVHRQEGSVRVKFVIYYNDKLFQTKQQSPTNENESTDKEITEVGKKPDSINVKLQNKTKTKEYKPPVLQISVGNVSFKNLNKPLIFVLPLVTKKIPTCVYLDETVNKWSTDGLTTNYTDYKVICRSSHMTAFSVLLDLTPDLVLDEKHEVILSIISYVGSVFSILGLSLTLITYLLFGCLNRDRPGKILSNLCFSLLMLNVTFVCLAIEPKVGGTMCAIIGLCLHYFVLTSLSWMCVEAVNMYQLLVYVFQSSETHFLLKRCFVAWGIPLLIVVVTASLRIQAYYENLNYCIISPRDPMVYYGTFLSPSCLILAANVTIFILVSRVIFKPRLAVKSCNSEQQQTITIVQVRGAFTVMVLLGVTWVFGTMAIGEMKIFFNYFFCIANSLQGFLIFLVRCLLYPEARNAWVHLFKTGKLKKHRGIVPPGTVSFSNSHGSKTPMSSSNAGPRNDNVENSPSVSLDGSLFNRNGHTYRNRGFTMSPSSTVGKSTSQYQNGKNPTQSKVKTPSNSVYHPRQKIATPKVFQKDIHKNTQGGHHNLQYSEKDFEDVDLGTSKQITFHSDNPNEVSLDKGLYKKKNLQCQAEGNYSKFSYRSYGISRFRTPKTNTETSSDEENFQKHRRSASVNDISMEDTSEELVLPTSTTIEGIKTFFTSIKRRSNDQIRDKRSLSLNDSSNTSPNSEKTEGVSSRFTGYKCRNSVVIERDEEYKSDDSNSTDIEDSPAASYRNRQEVVGKKMVKKRITTNINELTDKYDRFNPNCSPLSDNRSTADLIR